MPTIDTRTTRPPRRLAVWGYRIAAVTILALLAGPLTATAPAQAAQGWKTGDKCWRMYVQRYRLYPSGWHYDGFEWGFPGRRCPF